MIRIKRETAWLKAFCERQKPDLVISDNRYGLTIPGIYCVFVTHQLLIKTPFGSSADKLLQRINYRFIRRFSHCWIPDIEKNGGLAGELSHPSKMPHMPYRYIGCLSRFAEVTPAPRAEVTPAPLAGAPAGLRPAEVAYLLVLLSGPEPQRTLLEKIILEQASACPHRLVLVRGLPGSGRLSEVDWPVSGRQPNGIPEGMIIHDHLPAAVLEQVIRGAALVISRPGYSTVMDLARLKKNAVLVPTPGQTEQEYLGRRLAAMGWAVCMEQHGFSLTKALDARCSASFPAEQAGPLAEAIEEAIRHSCPPALG